MPTTQFAELALWEVAVLGLALNLVVTGSSIVLWMLLVDPTHRPNSATAVSSPRAWRWTMSTTLVNALLVVPAWLAWRQGWITLRSPSLGGLVLEFAYIAVAMDALLYWGHRAAHHRRVSRWVHQLHHTDDEEMTPLTLFVMNPLEAAVFGVAFMACVALVPVSIPTMALFFTLNLVVGTVAHLPVMTPAAASPSTLARAAGFHQAHHQHPDTNFGFFAPLWDRLGGTGSGEQGERGEQEVSPEGGRP